MLNTKTNAAEAATSHGVNELFYDNKQLHSNNGDIASQVAAYIRHGWYVVPIQQGSKRPATPGWQKKENCLTLGSNLPQGFGVGLAHAYSGTMALDIDDWQLAEAYLKEHDIDLNTLYNALDAVVINSGREGRGKLIYAMPFGIVMQTKKISHMVDGVNKSILEFRNATTNDLTVQDVLPPSIHPITQQPYQWGGKGHWSRPPMLPMEIYELWKVLVNRDAEKVIKVPEGANTSCDEVRSALSAIPADVPFDEWIQVLMAVHWAGVQLDQSDVAVAVADEWSSTGTKYKGTREVAYQMSTFKPDGGITLGTLFHMAHENGWVRDRPDVAALFKDIGNISDATKEPKPLKPCKTRLNIYRAIEWVLDGLIRKGLYTFAGQHGVGKSSAMVPLGLFNAGLLRIKDMQPNSIRRKVIYLTEDIEQIEAMIGVMSLKLDMSKDEDEISEWFITVPAKRMDSEFLAAYIKELRARYSYVNENGFTVEPLIIFDTTSSSIELDNENDNSQVGRFISAIKESMGNASVWTIGHLSKAAIDRKNAETFAFRGAVAWEADSHGTAAIFRDDDLNCVVLMTMKSRVHRKYTELHFTYHVETVVAVQPWDGQMQEQKVGFCTFVLGDKETRECRKSELVNEQDQKFIDAAIEYVRANQGDGKFLSPSKVANETYRVLFGKPLSGSKSKSYIAMLENDGRLVVMAVSPEDRSFHKINPKIRHFIEVRSVAPSL